MYRTRECWEEAYQVASVCTDQPKLRKQVAYYWAKQLGGEAAFKLLTRLGLVDTGIDYAMEQGSFEFALEMAELGSKQRLVEIHEKYAMYLEDAGKFVEAESEFIKVIFDFLICFNFTIFLQYVVKSILVYFKKTMKIIFCICLLTMMRNNFHFNGIF